MMKIIVHTRIQHIRIVMLHGQIHGRGMMKTVHITRHVMGAKPRQKEDLEVVVKAIVIVDSDLNVNHVVAEEK